MKVPSILGVGRHGKLLLSHRFIVTFKLSAMGFQQVSGLEVTEEVKYINEGGNNASPVLLKAQRTTPHFLTFKRGVVVSSVSLSSAINSAMSGGGISSFGGKGTPGTIIVLDENQDISSLYAFTSLGVVEWSLADLDAERPGILYETVKIAHGGLKKIAVPSF